MQTGTKKEINHIIKKINKLKNNNSKVKKKKQTYQKLEPTRPKSKHEIFWLLLQGFFCVIKVAEHSFQEPMPNSP